MSKALNRSSIRCKALNTATIGQTKNMNIPGAIITLPTLTESVFSLSISLKHAGYSRYHGVPEALPRGLHRGVLHPPRLRHRHDPPRAGSRPAVHPDHREDREPGRSAELRGDPGEGGRHHGGARRSGNGNGARESVPRAEIHAA